MTVIMARETFDRMWLQVWRKSRPLPVLSVHQTQAVQIIAKQSESYVMPDASSVLTVEFWREVESYDLLPVLLETREEEWICRAGQGVFSIEGVLSIILTWMWYTRAILQAYLLTSITDEVGNCKHLKFSTNVHNHNKCFIHLRDPNDWNGIW